MSASRFPRISVTARPDVTHYYSCVCVYLIRKRLALAVGELWLHEGVVEECRHVVVLSGKERVVKL